MLMLMRDAIKLHVCRIFSFLICFKNKDLVHSNLYLNEGEKLLLALLKLCGSWHALQL